MKNSVVHLFLVFFIPYIKLKFFFLLDMIHFKKTMTERGKSIIRITGRRQMHNAGTDGLYNDIKNVLTMFNRISRRFLMLS